MIPYAVSFYPLYFMIVLALGVPAALVLTVWLWRLAFLPQSCMRFAHSRVTSTLAMALLLAATAALGHLFFLERERIRLEEQIRRESAEKEARRNPVLMRETVLAGMTMPAGTRLALLHEGSVGEAAVKPEYFEHARFPQAVMWRGLPIKSIERGLKIRHCFEENGFDFDACKKLPEHERVKVAWGRDVEVELAEPQTLNGFRCQGRVGFVIAEHELKAEPNSVPRSDTDAARPAPEYVFDSCQAAAGNEFQTADGRLRFTLPPNSMIYSGRVLEQPAGEQGEVVDYWTARDYGDVLHTNLFSLKTDGILESDTEFRNYGFMLHVKSLKVQEMLGRISKGTPECSLAADTYIRWSAQRPDVLKVGNPVPSAKCGSFKIEAL